MTKKTGQKPRFNDYPYPLGTISGIGHPGTFLISREAPRFARRQAAFAVISNDLPIIGRCAVQTGNLMGHVRVHCGSRTAAVSGAAGYNDNAGHQEHCNHQYDHVLPCTSTPHHDNPNEHQTGTREVDSCCTAGRYSLRRT